MIIKAGHCVKCSYQLLYSLQKGGHSLLPRCLHKYSVPPPPPPHCAKKKSESAHKGRACQFWSESHGIHIYVAFLHTVYSWLRNQSYNVYHGNCSYTYFDKFGFNAEIQIIFWDSPVLLYVRRDGDKEIVLLTFTPIHMLQIFSDGVPSWKY